MRRGFALFAVLAMVGGLGFAAPASRALDLLVLATNGESTQLERVALDGHTANLRDARTLATFTHAHDGAARGALAADGSAWIMIESSARDHSFSGELLHVTSDRTASLRHDLAYASSPLVVGHFVFVQTGRAGVVTSPRRMRDDDVAITMLDANHPDAPAQTIVALRGQLAYPIGVDARDELLAYLVGPTGTSGEGGRLVAIELSTHALRDLGAVGTARDLSFTTQLVVEGRSRGPAVVYEAPALGGRRIVRARFLDGTTADLVSDRHPLSPRVDAEGVVHTTTSVGGAFEVLRVLDEHATVLQRYAPDRPLPTLVVRGAGGTTEIVGDARTRLEPVGLIERAR